MWKKLSIIWLASCFLCSFAADKDIDPVLKGKGFEDIRAAASKHDIYSEEDYALGKKLIARMKEMALNRKPALSVPCPVMEGIVYRYARLYYTENSWYDRQLFASRMLWNKSSSPFKKASVVKTMEILKDYGAGLSFFYNPSLYKLLCEAAKGNSDFKLLPTLFLNRRPELPADSLKRIAESPNSLKIDGKAVILSYACDRGLSPKQFAEYVEKLKKDHGRDDFTIVTEFTENCHRKNCGWIYGKPNWPSVHYRKTGKVSARHMLFFFDVLTEYLKNGGGIDLAVYAGEHDFTMSYRTFDELLLPLCGAACAQEGFNGKKLLTLQIMNGYAAVNGAQTLSSDGTLTARKYLELCRKYKVDIPMGFEWDELNELTNWEPTVSRPMAMQRIFKYYMEKEPAPLKGDDTDIPNFIISHRRQLPLGNKMLIEVLNIPDGVNKGKYSCKLELLDQDKKIIWSSDKWEFDAEKLKDMRFELLTEKFASAALAAPRLTVEYNGKTSVYGDGLPCTVLRAGVCTDASWFSTPLRNILKIQGGISLNEKRKITPAATEFTLDVDVKSPEKITSAEAVQNSMAIFSYDLANEYLQNDSNRFLYRINYRYINDPYKQVVNIQPEVKNAPSLIGFSYNHRPTQKAEQFQGKIPSFKLINGVMIAYQLFSIDKQDIEKAVLSFSGRREKGPTNGAELKLDVALKNIGETGVFSHVFEDGLAITVERHYLSAHLPLPLNVTELKFSAPVISDTQNSVIMARLISEKGKIYWSYGTLASKNNTDTTEKNISTYCDWRGTVKFPVKNDRLVEINYDFTPANGQLLYCNAGREFFAQAGSFTSTAISCEAELGSWHTIPFILMSREKGKLNNPAPTWVKEKDNSWALDFDGKSGNFLAFPGSVISQCCGFALTMDIMPRELEREQMIFRQYGPAYQTGFCIINRNGKVVVTFRYRDPCKEESGEKIFDTELKLKADTYQQLRMSYDGRNLTIAVDDDQQVIPCTGIPYWSTPSNFGGDISKNGKGQPSFFNGRLKSFKVERL